MISYHELVRRFGSPLYVYDLDEVRSASRLLRDELPEPHQMLYSLKANPLPALVGCLRQQGCGAEVSSLGEVRAALTAGYDAGELFFTGPAKSGRDLAGLFELGVRWFSFESRRDAERTVSEALRRRVPIQSLLRLNLPPTASAPSLRMGGRAQFGMGVDDAIALARSTPEAGVLGLHIYQGSNVTASRSLFDLIADAVQTAQHWRESGLPLRTLNLGGGFAAPYARSGPQVRYPGLRSMLEDELDKKLPGWRRADPRIVFESGRNLVATSGTLLCTVLDVKHNHGRDYVVTDSGIHHLGGLSGLGRLPPIHPDVTSPHAETTRATPHTAVGCLCTPADSWGRVNGGLPDPGGILSVPNVGAYGLTASLVGFLSHDLPPEVVVDGTGVQAVFQSRITRQEVPS